VPASTKVAVETGVELLPLTDVQELGKLLQTLNR
jgi:hypothetical protein